MFWYPFCRRLFLHFWRPFGVSFVFRRHPDLIICLFAESFELSLSLLLPAPLGPLWCPSFAEHPLHFYALILCSVCP